MFIYKFNPNLENGQFEIYLNDKTHGVDKIIRYNQSNFTETLAPLTLHGLNYLFYQIYGDITGKYFVNIFENNILSLKIEEYKKYYLLKFDEKEFKNKNIYDIPNWLD
ncbi:hypothetical protein CSPB12327_03540 [Campylobacter sp. RM12327]|uniref:hypothetical protein n=1 Tax=Campylobacter sputorum TaxID=206 RepID=UPI000B76F867|nr:MULTISPECIES: hypothetical protein [Campylobacter]MBE7357481.1 hypothetical protein [Campylobacter sp. RM11302]MBF6669219.1 hypothetical protein [Campylobacter sp. RM12327]MBF6674306.1 hypothetical protein [Campylobacter sp. RM13538]MBF6675347.1 hypothetical protein [Campylobacter sp. RM12321]MBF6676991.1 hypothetical protein [Campylobacter sp. RM11259]